MNSGSPGRAGGCVVAGAGGGQAWSDCVVSSDTTTHHKLVKIELNYIVSLI